MHLGVGEVLFTQNTINLVVGYFFLPLKTIWELSAKSGSSPQNLGALRKNSEAVENFFDALGKFSKCLETNSERSANSQDARQNLGALGKNSEVVEWFTGMKENNPFKGKKNLGRACNNLFALGTKWITAKTKRVTTKSISF